MPPASPTPVLPASTCSACSSEISAASPRFSDTASKTYCPSCFENLRAAPTDNSPAFACSLCGLPQIARNLSDWNGRLVCRQCRSNAAASDAAIGIPAEPIQLSTDWPKTLLQSVTCPHCWHSFPTDQILWVSQHSELRGDPQLGPEAAVRFLPSRINLKGQAIDGRGMPCHTLACPHCHLVIPRAFLAARPLFASIVGAPASGKSNFLASLTWQLRRSLPAHFAMTLNDADPAFNRVLHEYEETLFLQNDPNHLVAIRKTELTGETYDLVRFGEQIVSFPKPLIFTLRPTPQHPVKTAPPLSILCMYDNAGEHYQPDMDLASSPGTRHLAQSKALFFLYDPTQHPRIREQCRTVSHDPQLDAFSRTNRQETLLTEAASRVRKHTGLPADARHKAILVVVVTKSDVWSKLLRQHAQLLEGEPFLSTADTSLMDTTRVERVSSLLRQFLLGFTPEFIAAAEEFCQRVIYIPVSALGCAPTAQADTGVLGVRPADIKPLWVTVPLLYLLAKMGRGLIQAAPPPPRPPVTQPAAASPRAAKGRTP